jgi:hypothetical protein
MYLMDWTYKQPKEEMIEDKVLLDTLCLDYITLTSYDTQLLEATARYIISRIPEHMPTAKNRMQYAGLVCDGVFYGVGRQHQGLHAILQVPGYRAWNAALAAQLGPEGVRCSRFDLQVTIDAALVPSIERLFDTLNSADTAAWNHTGPRPKLQHIRNSDGYDTLYIGTRTSELFRRIYVKPIEGKDYVRFEVEIKGNLARALWERRDVSDRQAQADLFRHQFYALPGHVQSDLRPFLECVGQGSGEFVPVNRGTDAEAAIEWFGSGVAPALDKARQRGYFDQVCAILASQGYNLSVRTDRTRTEAENGEKGQERDGIRTKD